MYRASLRQLEPDDPQWGTPPLRPPDVFISVLPTVGDESVSRSATRWPGTLIAYDWIFEGRKESVRPVDLLDTSRIEAPDGQVGDRVRFEIHAVAMPRSITVMRVFDLGEEDSEDFDPVLEWFAMGNSEPEGQELIYEKSGDSSHWKLDVPLTPTQEASHVVLQAMWTTLNRPGASFNSASWVFKIGADPRGQIREERLAIRDRMREESGTRKPIIGDGGPVAWVQNSGFPEIAARLDSIMTSPVGRAFSTIAARSDMSPNELAVPQTTVWLCTTASDEVDVWDPNRNDILAYLDRESPKHVGFLSRILEQERASWWFEPLDRESQIWLTDDGSQPDRESLITPTVVPDRWELYAQKTAGGLFTSTLIGDTSPMSAAICDGVGDFRPAFGKPPYEVWRMTIAEEARVLEIHSAHDWHSLCAEYPATNDERIPGQTPDFSGDPGRLEPDWSKVAAKWDAVHLSFGGYLTATQVRVESEAGWTYHWAWDCECTLWLRWKFTGSERIEDHRDSDLHPDFGSRLFSAMMEE